MSTSIKLWGITVTSLILLFSSFLFSVDALLHVPISYTRPTGLQSVNGSDAFGGCPQTPQNCIATEGGVDVCRCPGNTPATGVLIDTKVPMIDPTSDVNWASELFTVNRNGQSSIIIGFFFSSPFVLSGVEINLFNCPAWNIVASTINVYGSLVFPTFIMSSTPIGRINISLIQDCHSLSTVVIPVQLNTSPRSTYFIEMTFDQNPRSQWAPSIAEIQFSDETPTQPPLTTYTPTTTITGPTVTMSSNTELSEQPSITGNITNIAESFITSMIMATPHVTIKPTSATTETIDENSISFQVISTSTRTIYISSMTLTPSKTTTSFISSTSAMTTVSSTSTTTTASTETSMSDPTSDGTTTIIAVLVAIIGVLIVLLIVGAFAVLGCLVFQKSSKKRKVEMHQFKQDDKMEHLQEPVRYSMIRETDTAVNQHYEDLRTTGYAAISSIKDEELYSIVKDERNGSRDGLDTIGNGLYQDIDTEPKLMTHKTTPPKLETFDSSSPHQPNNIVLNDYAHVVKPLAPPVPPKTPEFYREIKVEKEEGWKTVTDTPSVIVSEYNDGSGANVVTEKEIYCEIGSSNQPPASPSGPVLLSKSLFNEMDENPDYESSGSAILFAGMANKGREEGGEIYANPDVRFTQEEIYDTIYSEPIQPSLFDPKAVDHEEEIEDIQPYSPIYTLAVMPDLSDDMSPLYVSHNNIFEKEDLGTGFFGNVVLAETMGLSRKDLKLSESDDDKTVTMQVAVKTLKRNASEKQKLAFEKEYKFMARLSHPNVICMLAVCNEDDPFIMMEYMEYGDLNQYLQKFTSISNVSVQSESEIEMTTLVYMAKQIASAMIYLASQNYVHRDLATRNCLVGQNFLVKLGDFGMSRNLYDSHYYIIRGHAILPVRWMASECFCGKFSAKTDVWAFGVTVWEIFTLAKEKPYSQMNDHEVARNAIKREKRILLMKPPNCPQKVYNVMLKCWASDPKERATFEELYEALSSLNFSNKDNDEVCSA